MSVPVYLHSLQQSDTQHSPQRLPFGYDSYSVNGFNDINILYPRNIHQEDDESTMIDPSSPASSSYSEADPVLRGVARRKVIMHSPQTRFPSAFFPCSRTPPKSRTSSSAVSASTIESPNRVSQPFQPNRPQSWLKAPLCFETCDGSLPTQAVEESQFDAYSDDGAEESEMAIERRLGKLKRFGRRMSNAFRHLRKA